MNKRTRAAASVAGGALAAGLGAYPLFFRRWCLTWGARPDEVARKLPGDELLADAGIVSTRAVTIDAPPGAIWPWLVQMGSGRGGVYTYDWIENLFGLDMHSAREILPPALHAGHGARQPGHGAQDVARHQGARREAGPRTGGITSAVSRRPAGRPPGRVSAWSGRG
jgi:hypothetical protein